jgi:hypothetical protein
MGEEPRLAGFTEKPVLILPPFARDLGFTVGAVSCQYHTETPFTDHPVITHPPKYIAKPLPEYKIT